MARTKVSPGRHITGRGFFTQRKLICGNCGAEKLVAAQQRGKTLCPRCGKAIRIG